MTSENQYRSTTHIEPGVFALMSPDGEEIILAKPPSDEAMEKIRQGLHIEKAPPNLTLGELETDIIEYIGDWHNGRYGSLGCPTFTCLEQRYGRPRSGGTDLELTGSKNVILWQGLSQNLAQAIVDLSVNLRIHWHPTLAISYINEGRPLPLPIASYPITEEYAKPHWLPVEFYVGSSCDDAFCPTRTHDSH